MSKFLDYDNGFRAGTFDKCNGRSCAVALDSDMAIWDDGYLDGWNNNTVRIRPTILMETVEINSTEYEIGELVEHIEAMTQDMSRDTNKIMFDISKACKAIRALLEQG